MNRQRRRQKEIIARRRQKAEIARRAALTLYAPQRDGPFNPAWPAGSPDGDLLQGGRDADAQDHSRDAPTRPRAG